MILHDAHITPTTRTLATPNRNAKRPFALRHGLRLRVWDEAGFSGEGEAAPLEGFTSESLDCAKRALEKLVAAWKTQEAPAFGDVEDVITFAETRDVPPTVSFAVEQALLSLLAARRGTSVARLLGANHTRLPLSHTLVHDAEEAHRAVHDGAEHLKIKVGSNLPDVLERVGAIRERVGPEIALRLDANGAWDVATAGKALEALQAFDIAFVEDPISGEDLDAYRTLRDTSGIPIALDAPVRSLAALKRIIQAQAADIVVIKPMFIGGLARALRMIREAHAAGLRVVITSTFESEVGIAGACAVALAAPPQALLTCGLGSDHLHPRPPQRDASVPYPLLTSALARPTQTALTIVSPEGLATLTFQALADRVAEAATVLAERGIGPGSRVAIAGPRSCDWVIWLHALGWRGATAVLYPFPAARDALARTQDHIPVDAVVSPTEVSGVTHIPWTRPVVADRIAPVTCELDTPAVVVLTSGSTGAPKPVTLSARQLLFSALGSTIRLGHHRDDVWASALPLEHVGGLSVLWRTALLGTTARIYTHFDAHLMNREIDGEIITQVSLVPTALTRLLDAREERPFPHTLRLMLLGGAAATPELIARARRAQAPLALTWGMSETASQVATGWCDETEPSRAVGAPLPFVDVRALPDGCLRVTGAMAPRGGITTQDLGRVDVAGHVHVTGRRDRMIISGGSNIAPTEIEAALETHPTVREACVVGLTDPEWGERPHALLVPAHPDAPPDEGELRSFLTDRLRRYKVPKSFTCITELPRTSSGKIALPRVREILETRP